MEHEILGWPPDGQTLRLDHERFSYAGKFVMTNTGKAITRLDGDVVAAVAFNEDRTDETTCWFRYVTVDRDRRGEGIGPSLLRFARDRVLERGYDRVRIAVNNPYAFEALYRTGFEYTGETTGLAELVLEYDPDAAPSESPMADRYRAGLEEFRGRDLTDAETAFLEERLERGPQDPVGPGE